MSLRTAGAALALALGLGACAGPISAPPTTRASVGRVTASALPSAAQDGGCGDPAASLRPQGALPAPGAFPAGSLMRAIYDRGKLIAGVSQDTLLFGYLNASTNQLEGFDIDVVKQVSRAIFGDESHVEYRAISPAQSVPLLQRGNLDIVARTFAISCANRKLIDYSSVYYSSGQRVLVGRSSAVQGMQDLGGKRVCAPAGTTSLDTIARAASHPVPVAVSTETDCLVLLQRGEVDAVSMDDTMLLGLEAQDQTTKVVGPKLTDEPYGIGIGQGHPEFVRFVNAVLERMRADGTWTATYNRWLARFGPVAGPPAPAYRD